MNMFKQYGSRNRWFFASVVVMSIFYPSDSAAVLTEKQRQAIVRLSTKIKAGDLESVKKVVPPRAGIVKIFSQNSELVGYILKYAIEYGKFEIVKYLVDHVVSVKTYFKDIGSPLTLAALYGKQDILQYILSKNIVGIETTDPIGFTVLFHAVKGGYCDLVKYLVLNRKAKIFVKSKNGWSPFHCAISKESLEIMNFLCEQGVYIDVEGSDKYTALHFAASEGLFNATKWLVEHKANINAKEKDDWTPLHLAAQKGNLDLVKYLVEKGAKIDEKNKNNCMPLHIAAQNGHLDIVKYLVEKGVNVFEKNKAGLTARMCVPVDKEDLIDYLVFAETILKDFDKAYGNFACEYPKYISQNECMNKNTVFVSMRKKLRENFKSLLHLVPKKNADQFYKEFYPWCNKNAPIEKSEDSWQPGIAFMYLSFYEKFFSNPRGLEYRKLAIEEAENYGGEKKILFDRKLKKIDNTPSYQWQEHKCNEFCAQPEKQVRKFIDIMFKFQK